ncbi:hypothetical protein SLEP1_g3540 [Rubroshorea leprosula]|uniref:Uncharacterized protein n=1 Tax=Rubroshorea leprosula TaxID=152421 RepID=A0AAV5HV30_9ROSI|nr:hypothetical protein SLEP1_g3540 [Rubroshorea leprosula]
MWFGSIVSHALCVYRSRGLRTQVYNLNLILTGLLAQKIPPISDP